MGIDILILGAHPTYEMQYNPIQIAEKKLGFQKCYPYAKHDDESPRWLKGGGLWSSADVIAFVEHKLEFDKTLDQV